MDVTIQVACVINVIALLANFIAYALPWQHVIAGSNTGYWGTCHDGLDCSWYFHDGFYDLRHAQDYKATGWFKASIALFGIGIILHLVAFILAFIHIVCKTKSGFNCVIGMLLSLAFSAIGTAVILYGLNMHGNLNIRFQTSGPRFHAAFYLGIVSAALTLLTSMLYNGVCFRTRS